MTKGVRYSRALWRRTSAASHKSSAVGRYKQSRNGYRDAVYVVEALRECFGDDTVTTDPRHMDGHIRSWTGVMQIKTLDLAPAKSTRRRRPNNRNKQWVTEAINVTK